jgi:hypothetical protein
MSKLKLDELHLRRHANLDHIVQLLALQLGYDISTGIAPDLRDRLEEEAEFTYQQWREAADSEPRQATPQGDLQKLLADRTSIDEQIQAIQDGNSDIL